MAKRRRYTYYEYNLLASPKKRGTKMSDRRADKFLEAILEAAARLKLEIVGGCRPHPARSTARPPSPSRGRYTRL